MNINSKLIISALALSLSAGIALAQDPGGPPRRGGPGGQPGGPGGRPGGGPGSGGPRFMPPIMAALDANADGVIDENEIANASKALKTLDKDGDGKLTREEYMGVRPGGPGGPGSPGVQGERPGRFGPPPGDRGDRPQRPSRQRPPSDQ